MSHENNLHFSVDISLISACSPLTCVIIITTGESFIISYHVQFCVAAHCHYRHDFLLCGSLSHQRVQPEPFAIKPRQQRMFAPVCCYTFVQPGSKSVLLCLCSVVISAILAVSNTVISFFFSFFFCSSFLTTLSHDHPEIN